MKARVKASYKTQSIIAFSGLEFVKFEWRNVPASKEAEALRHPLLDIEGVVSETVKAKPASKKESKKSNTVSKERSSLGSFMRNKPENKEESVG